MTQINLRLKEIRRRNNLSQEELARQLGISRQAVIALEQGTSLPSLPVIVAMLKVLDIPFSDLLTSDWTPFRVFNPSDKGEQYNLANLRHGDEDNTIPIKLEEHEGSLIITAELAGVREEDVTIDLSHQHVLLMAIRKPKHPQPSTQTHLSEIQYGPLMRILSLPYPVDTQAAQAEFDRGLLYLQLPRLLPQTKRRITFQNNN